MVQVQWAVYLGVIGVQVSVHMLHLCPDVTENQSVQSCSMQRTELHEPGSACSHCAVLCSFCPSIDLLQTMPVTFSVICHASLQTQQKMFVVLGLH